MTRAMARALGRIVRPLRRSLFGVLVGVGGVMAGHAHAQSGRALGADSWAVYGTSYTHERDAAVPGSAIIVVQPHPSPTAPWSSGASLPIPDAIPAGERVTAVFWARAVQAAPLTIGVQGGAPAYARFASADVTLTKEWRRVSVSGTAPADFAANTQSLSLPLGQVGTQVMLGPVAFFRGRPSDADIARTFAAFRPSEVASDVRIPSEPGVVLAGTLHLPAGHGHAPFPLAVLIQGHGPNGRGGFTQIVKRLTVRGIAVLEYDKRGIGQSTGRYEEDIERLTTDAAAAVAAMRRRPDIDGHRIAVIGHSQGGVIAPAVAAADPGIAAVVMLAGSVGDGLPYLRRALYNQMIAAGRPETAAASVVDAAITLLQARIDGKDAQTIERLRAAVIDGFEAAGFARPQAEGALAMIDTEEARRGNKLRSASDLKALHIPVLAVFGAKDPLVVASDEAPEARKALAHNPRGEVVVLEGLSHWFQEGAITGGEEEVAKLGPNAGSPRLVALVAGWLNDTLNRHSTQADKQPVRTQAQ